jgi:hypothetical protein
LSTRQQKHTIESIYDQVKFAKNFPYVVQNLSESRFEPHMVYVPPGECDLLNIVFLSFNNYSGNLSAASCIQSNQHDKWGQFGLWLHAGLEAFSGEINWLKIWWTNKNPRLVGRYYIDTCRQIGGRSLYTTPKSTYELQKINNRHSYHHSK